MKKGCLAITIIFLTMFLIDVLFNTTLAEEIEKCFFRNLARRICVEGETIESFLYDHEKGVGFDYRAQAQCQRESLLNKLLEPFTTIGINKRTSFGLYYYLTKSSKSPPEYA